MQLSERKHVHSSDEWRYEVVNRILLQHILLACRQK